MLLFCLLLYFFLFWVGGGCKGLSVGLRFRGVDKEAREGLDNTIGVRSNDIQNHTRNNESCKSNNTNDVVTTNKDRAHSIFCCYKGTHHRTKLTL